MNIGDIIRAAPVQPAASSSAPSAPSARAVRSGKSAAVEAAEMAVAFPAGPAGAETEALKTAPPSLREGEARDTLDQALSQIKEFVEIAASDIDFSIDEKSGEMVVKIIDRATEEVIRQIPPEEMLEIARALDRLQGLFLQNKA
ncbi:MAG: flagellar protein FlaG [Candidatus Accumulibacter sp.]|jgi:flagellar protein FlaG|nr:flagellar protein FlaG [Accumulibacter sp.]